MGIIENTIYVQYGGAGSICSKEFYQWNRGVYLNISGVPSTSTVIVQYANEYMTETMNPEIQRVDGVIVSKIPDTLLMLPYAIKCYICVSEDDTSITVMDVCIPIVKRAKPSGYVYTPEELIGFNDLLSRLDISIAEVNELKSSIDESVTQANIAAQNAKTAANAANASAQTADASAVKIDNMTVTATTLETGSPATALLETVDDHYHLSLGLPKGDTGDTGPQGPKGDPGKDAVIDTTLTQAGQAADAKATGEAISSLKNDKLDKTATAADASKLGGQQPSYYATAESVSNISYNNAGAHNSIYRGKNLGSAVTAAQWEEIGAGTFGNMFVGDYWYINSIYWRIGGFNYWYNYGDTACSKPHVLIVPDQNLLNADGSTTHWMNATDTTSGAYVGSDFYTGNNGNTGKAQCRSMAQSAFGSAHILTHREYLQNAVTNGYESGGAWYDSDVEIMNEKMVYGCEIFSNQTSGTNIPAKYTIDNAQIPLFALDHSRICNRANWWLRDVVSGSNFAVVINGGGADFSGASSPWIGVRPAFAICA